MTAPTDTPESTTAGSAAPLSSFALTGQHVVITGGGRGLGRGIAEAVAAAGAEVTIIARSADQLREAADSITERGGCCHRVEADLSDIEAIPRLVERITERGAIDGVVHAAGVQVRKPAVDITPGDWQFVQSVNATAPFFLSAAIARGQLSEDRPGSHVFIGSLNSTIGLANIAPYAAAKTALLGMARSMSTEWSGSGLRANVIGPGYFHTELTADLFANEADRARIISRIPMGRLGTAADLGGVVVFLLSAASAYVTGQLINVDGGWLAA